MEPNMPPPLPEDVVIKKDTAPSPLQLALAKEKDLPELQSGDRSSDHPLVNPKNIHLPLVLDLERNGIQDGKKYIIQFEAKESGKYGVSETVIGEVECHLNEVPPFIIIKGSEPRKLFNLDTVASFELSRDDMKKAIGPENCAGR